MEIFNNLKLNYKIWFSNEANEGIMGDGKWQILKAINEAGSLTKACENMGITYRRTWNDLKKIEKTFGFQLLESTRGGADGGGMKLTPEGERLVMAFDNFHKSVDTLMQKHFISMLDELKNSNK